MINTLLSLVSLISFHAFMQVGHHVHHLSLGSIRLEFFQSPSYILTNILIQLECTVFVNDFVKDLFIFTQLRHRRIDPQADHLVVNSWVELLSLLLIVYD